MFIDVKLLNGDTASVDPSAVIRIRPAHGMDETPGTVFIDYVSAGVFTVESLADIQQKFGRHIRLASLHSPIGSTVLLNADGIASVVPADKTLHHPDAHSVAVFKAEFINPKKKAVAQQQLSDRLDKARKSLEAAKLVDDGGKKSAA